MIFHIDFNCGRPLYLQLVDQVRYAAASGALQPRDPLPSIRAVAKRWRINRNTVAKAYGELESANVIQTIMGKGCFLRENDSPLTQPVRRKMLAGKIDEALVMAHQMNTSQEALRSLLEERIQFFRTQNSDYTKRPAEKPISKPNSKPNSASPSTLLSLPLASVTEASQGWSPSID